MLEVDKPAHRRRYLGLADEDELVDQRPAQPERDRALLYAARGAVRQGRPAALIENPAGLDRMRHDGGRLGLTAHDADFRVAGPEHAGDAANEPATADSNVQGIDIWHQCRYFDSAGALTCDDLSVIVWRHVRHAALNGVLACV